jgi:hypothetical protein
MTLPLSSSCCFPRHWRRQASLLIATRYTKQLVEQRTSAALMRSAMPGQSLDGLHN